MKVKKILLFFLLGVVGANNVYAVNQAIIEKNTIELDNKAKKTAYLGTYGEYYSKHPSQSFDFFDNNGYFNIVYLLNDDTKLGWVTYDINNKTKISEKTIERKLSIFGNGIYHNNYLYIMYGKNDSVTTDSSNSNYGTTITLELVKYDMNGNIVKTLEIPGVETSWIDKDNPSYYIFKGYGTKWPFQSGQCDMAINSQGIMEIVLNRLMYNGHTMSVNLFVNTSNLEYLTKRSTLDSNNMYYHVTKNYNVGHSFEERVIALSDDEFFFADLSDGTPERGFYIARTVDGTKKQLESLTPFHFRESDDSGEYNYNETFASLGNIIEVSDGLILIGSSEKTLSLNYALTRNFNESRNLFVQKYIKSLDGEASSVSILNTPVRQSEESRTDTKNKGSFELKDKQYTDYGVKWLTNYNNDYASTEVRAVKINNDNILIIWSNVDLKKSSNGNYYLSGDNKKYYYMIIDKDANIVREATPINNAIPVDYIHYNYRNGYVYWASVLNDGNEMFINKLDVNATESEPYIGINWTNPSNITITDIDDNTRTLKIVKTDGINVIWESSNASVVSVDNNGKITALKNGTAIVTASLEGYNDKKVEFNVTVDFKIKSLTPSPESLSIEVGDYKFIYNTVVYPDEAAVKKIVWKSSDESIATVGDYGSGTVTFKVNAVGPGKTTIIGTADDGSGVTTSVEIDTYIKFKDFTLENTSYQLVKGDKVKISYTTSPSNATDEVTFSTNDSNIASVDEKGNITANGNGTTYIYLSTKYSKISKRIQVVVTSPLKDIVLNKSNFYLKVNDKDKITVTSNPTDTTDSYTVSFSSNNTGVATVDRYGNITAKSNGTAIITVKTSTGIEKTCTVIVGDYLKGDMNKNGKIDLQDIIILLKKYLNNDATSDELAIGDMDSDSNIGLKDIIILLKEYLNG